MSRCAECGREIVWAHSSNGNLIPLSKVAIAYRLDHDDDHPETPQAEKVQQDRESGHAPLYISHFVDCPGAKKFSGRNKGRKSA